MFRAFGPEDVLAAHAYYTTAEECVLGLAGAMALVVYRVLCDPGVGRRG